MERSVGQVLAGDLVGSCEPDADGGEDVGTGGVDGVRGGDGVGEIEGADAGVDFAGA